MLDDAKLLASAICLDYSSYLNIRLAKTKFKAIEVFMSGRADEVLRGVEGVLPGESATARAAHESLKGDRRGIRKLLPFLGPAFIAAVAYVGNLGTSRRTSQVGCSSGICCCGLSSPPISWPCSSSLCRPSWGSRRARICPRFAGRVFRGL